MKHTAIAGGLALSLCLSACNNSPEEAPDITEAIPLDDVSEPAPGESSQNSADAQDNSAERAGAQPPALPPAQTNGQSNTMESGSNADGGRKPDPSRTKLLPAE